MSQHQGSRMPKMTKTWLGVTVSLLAILTAACGGSSDGADEGGGSGDRKLVIVAQSFACNTNDFTANFCKGVEAATDDVADDVKVEFRSGLDFTDQNAYNSLLQNATTLQPAVMAVFGTSPDAQVPTLTAACDQGIEVIIMDQDMPNLECRTSTVASDFSAMGEEIASWLFANDTSDTKQVGLVGFTPGTIPAVEAGYTAFKDSVEAKGYEVVGEVAVEGGDQEKIRSAVENLLTSNPDMNVLYSSSDSFDVGVSQALKAQGRLDITRISTDGCVTCVQRILDGTGMTADVAKSAYLEGYTSVTTAAKLAQGEDVGDFVSLPYAVIDATNAEAYLEDPATYLQENGKTSS
jgi:ABC-type sugar transport system substrate-binding protein